MSAHEHVVNFQKGVDAYDLGHYHYCDDYWFPLARAGDPMATYNMGILFHKGQGVRQDIKEAVLYYEMASNQGVTSANLLLGILYLKGNEIPRDFKKAHFFLKRAASAGDSTAQYNLGLLYEYGIGVDIDKDIAWRFYHSSARSGHPKASVKMSLPPKQFMQLNIRDNQGENFDSLPSIVEKKKITLEEKKEIYNSNHKNTDHNKIFFLRELQQDIPHYIYKYDKKSDTYYSQTPSIKNPYDQPEKNLLFDNPLKPSHNISAGEVAHDRQIIKAHALYKKALQFQKNKNFQLFYKTLEETIQLLDSLLYQHYPPAAFFLGRIYFKLFQDLNNTYDVMNNNLFLKAYDYFKLSADQGSPRAIFMLDQMRLLLTDEEFNQMEQR